MKRIKLSSGDFMELPDGYLYRAISSTEYDLLLKKGRLTPRNESGRIYFTNNANLSRALAVDGSQYVVRVRADNLGDVSHDSNVPSVVPSVYGRKDIPIDLVTVQGRDGSYVKFTRSKDGFFTPSDTSAKGVGLNGRNIPSEREVLQMYKNAEDRLIAVIARGNPKSNFNVYRAQQLRAIREVIAQLDDDVQEFVDDHVEQVYTAGFNDTLFKIQQHGETQFQFKFSGVDREAIRVLTEKAYLNFGKAIQGMGLDARQASMNRVAIQNEIIGGAIQGRSFSTSTSDVVKTMRSKGLEAFVGGNGRGRSFKAIPYANLIVRSQNVYAYNIGAKNRMLSAGRCFALFPKLRPDIDGIDICNAWEDKQIIDLRSDPVPTDSTHPQCRHIIQPVSFAYLLRSFPQFYPQAIAYFEQIAGFRPDV